MLRGEQVFVLAWGLAVLLSVVQLALHDAPVPVLLSLIVLLPRPSCFAPDRKPGQAAARHISQVRPDVDVVDGDKRQGR